jgi:hypothetical protein
MAGPVFFEGDDAGRVRDFVRRVEGASPPTGRGRAAARAPGPTRCRVEVTSTTTVGGRYPGRVVVPDVSTSPPTWEAFGDVWVIDANAAALAARTYRARLVGFADGRPVAMVGCCAPAGCCPATFGVVDPLYVKFSAGSGHAADLDGVSIQCDWDVTDQRYYSANDTFTFAGRDLFLEAHEYPVSAPCYPCTRTGLTGLAIDCEGEALVVQTGSSFLYDYPDAVACWPLAGTGGGFCITGLHATLSWLYANCDASYYYTPFYVKRSADNGFPAFPCGSGDPYEETCACYIQMANPDTACPVTEANYNTTLTLTSTP